MANYTADMIVDYLNNLDEGKTEEVLAHCEEFEIYPEISEWYADRYDFYDKWRVAHLQFATDAEAERRLQDGIKIGELKVLSSGEIVKFVF